MIDTKTLSIKDKISLLNELYEELSGHGVGGDTELAHINPWEADLLRSVGGAGTVNEVTGLRQYLGGSSSPAPAPTQTTTRQVPEYAPEQREYVSDVFGKAQELYEQRTEEGFQPFPGAQLAPYQPQEEEAFRGIESLARGPGAAPAFDIARSASLGAAAPVTASEIQNLMNPYQQNVMDIAKREARRQYQRGPQAQLRTGAVESGGLRGTRRFVEEAEGERNLQQLMNDIQMRGGQEAYTQAMAEAAAGRGRLANLAAQMPSIGTGAYQQQMAQLGQLGGVGEAQRAREQAAIDLAANQYQRELMFPEETLATYLRFITNAPSPSGFQQTRQAPGVPGPSTISQLGGLAGGLGTLAGGLGGTKGLFNRGGAVPPASGRQAGLSGVVRRARGGQIVRMQDGRSIAQKYAEAYGYPERNSATTYEPIEILTPPLTMRDFPAAGAASVVTAEQGREIADRRLMEDIVKGSVQGGDIYPDMPDLSEEEKVTQKATSLVSDEAVGTEPEVTGDKEQSLAERYAAYRKLMEGDDTESELSWPERLQIASAFFSAADAPSTGSFMGDLAQFGAKVGPGAAKGLAARDARELAAKKRRIQSVKDFRAFIKEEQLRPLEIAKLAADLGYTQAQTNKLVSEYTNPEVASPSEVDIAGAISYLDRMGVPVLETSKEKGKYGKAGSAYQLAQVAKSLKTSADHALRIAKERGAVAKDPDGRLLIDVDKAIRGGSRRVDQPVRGVTRGADGKLVAKAEGGMVGEKPVLRYPEDFS